MFKTLIADLTDPRLWLIVLFVSAIGLIEKLAIYRAGQQSASIDPKRAMGIDPERAARLETLFETRGSYILILVSIPGIGAALSIVAGAIGVKAATFIFWVSLSNLIRNWLIVILSGQIINLF